MLNAILLRKTNARFPINVTQQLLVRQSPHHALRSFWAVVTVFFVSAVAHELCMGIPLHMRSFWAFIGIMGQVPLIMATEKLKVGGSSAFRPYFAFI